MDWEKAIFDQCDAATWAECKPAVDYLNGSPINTMADVRELEAGIIALTDSLPKSKSSDIFDALNRVLLRRRDAVRERLGVDTGLTHREQISAIKDDPEGAAFLNAFVLLNEGLVGLALKRLRQQIEIPPNIDLDELRSAGMFGDLHYPKQQDEAELYSGGLQAAAMGARHDVEAKVVNYLYKAVLSTLYRVLEARMGDDARLVLLPGSLNAVPNSDVPPELDPRLPGEIFDQWRKLRLPDDDGATAAYDAAVMNDYAEKIRALLAGLTPREQELMRWRYGLTDGKPHSFGQTAEHFRTDVAEVMAAEGQLFVRIYARAYRQPVAAPQPAVQVEEVMPAQEKAMFQGLGFLLKPHAAGNVYADREVQHFQAFLQGRCRRMNLPDDAYHLDFGREMISARPALVARVQSEQADILAAAEDYARERGYAMLPGAPAMSRAD